MIKKIFFLVIMANIVNAKCFYVDCTSSVVGAVANTQATMQSNFTMVDSRVEELNKKYDDYNDIIEKNNEKLEDNLKVKSKYLLLLTEINLAQEKIVNILKDENNEK